MKLFAPFKKKRWLLQYKARNYWSKKKNFFEDIWLSWRESKLIIVDNKELIKATNLKYSFKLAFGWSKAQKHHLSYQIDDDATYSYQGYKSYNLKAPQAPLE